MKKQKTILYIGVISFVVTLVLNYKFLFNVLMTIIKYINFECIILTLQNY